MTIRFYSQINSSRHWMKEYRPSSPIAISLCFRWWNSWKVMDSRLAAELQICCIVLQLGNFELAWRNEYYRSSAAQTQGDPFSVTLLQFWVAQSQPLASSQFGLALPTLWKTKQHANHIPQELWAEEGPFVWVLQTPLLSLFVGCGFFS